MIGKGIEIENVTFSYPGKHPQLQNISLHIQPGTFVGITGINGSGKTTLSLLLNGLIPHEIPGHLNGNIFIDSINTRTKPVSYFARKVGMLFQNPEYMLFNLTVAEEIAFGIKNLKLNDRSGRIKQSLELVGLPGFENRDPQTLSLGEKQKITLACVLATDSLFIILDEPVAMLDYRGAVNLYEALDLLNKQFNKTIIVIEHDTDFLLHYTNKTVIIDKGKIIMEGDTRTVFANFRELKQIGIKIPHPIE